MMGHLHATAFKEDLEEAGRPPSSRIPQQRGPRVEAELIRDRRRAERPGRVHVAATVEVRTDRGQPLRQRVPVEEPLAGQVGPMLSGGVQGIVAGDEEPPRGPR
jgi:hypothetical protein